VVASINGAASVDLGAAATANSADRDGRAGRKGAGWACAAAAGADLAAVAEA
jgi:hypothetical protein